MRIWNVLRVWLPVAMLCGCGGGSGGGGDAVQFMGTLQDTAAARESRALSDVEICALGSCSITDAAGTWNFEVDEEGFSGGDVLFTFAGSGLAAQSVVRGLSPQAEQVVIDFLAVDAATVTVQALSQNGTPIANPTPIPTPDPEPELSDDPSERACQLIDRTNVAIPNAVTQVLHSMSSTDCPQEVDTIIAVANPGTVPFEYEVTVDLQDITVQPLGGFLLPGEIERHHGTYLCTAAESFDTEINVRVTTLRPEGLDPLTDEQALELCGARASIGNLTESSPVQVIIEP